MKPNLVMLALWISALRSGNYNQTRRRLCREDGGVRSYCCLGVAVDLVEPSTYFDNASMRELGFPSASSAKKYGFETGKDMADDRGNRNSLTVLNDTYNYSFSQISDVIEDRYLPNMRHS